MKHFFPLLFSVSLLLSCPLSAMQLSLAEAEKIGQGIFFNECGGKKDHLVWWNDGEHFASLGIGHFIWYPEGVRGPYDETFPSLLAFFEKEGVEVPDWLKGISACPWGSKEALMSKSEESKKKELQDLLLRTVSLQTTFIGNRFQNALRDILASMDEETGEAALEKMRSLESCSQGKFALIDYLNFKGAGTSKTERYKGKGWGLKQVLEEMPGSSKDPLRAFAETAKSLLKARVENAPNRQGEERFLPGWLNRIDRYLKS